MKVAFITSTGRTGTGLLTKLFNEHTRNAVSFHEPKPVFRRRSRHLVRRSPTIYERYYFKWPRLRSMRRSGKDWYVENNFHLFAGIPLIRQTFPDAKVIHLVRDGRDVVTSYLNRWRYIKVEYLTPWDFNDKAAMPHWPEWNPLQKLSWYWKSVNEHALAMQPDHVFSFEKIFTGNTEGALELLQVFDGLEYAPADIEQALSHKVNQNKIDFFPSYPEWPGRWQDQFKAIAGETMTKLGYAE